METDRYGIIGFGCAGYHAAKTIRRFRPRAQIDIFESGRGLLNPMLTTYFVEGKLDQPQMYPFGDPDSVCGELSLNLVRAKVEQLRPERMEITAGGMNQRYTSILIASGASAAVPPFAKTASKPVFFMRTEQDAQLLKEYLQRHSVRRAVVIGASMVGIKVTEALFLAQVETVLLDGAPQIFPLAAFPSMAGKIEEVLQKHGIELRCGVRVLGIGAGGVELADQADVPCDIVCLCVGTRANLDFLPADGAMAPETRRGVVVNTRMETSCSGVFAAGDCCEGGNLQTGGTAPIGLWAKAAAQGICAGSNMVGMSREYYGTIPHNTARFLGTTFAGAGDPSYEGERFMLSTREMDLELVLDGGQLICFNLLGNSRISGVLKSILLKRILSPDGEISDCQQAILKQAGLTKDLINKIGGDKNGICI